MSWTSLHCRLSWRPEHIDEFIAGKLAPLLDSDWFFVRYWESGPHLRIRYRGELDIVDKIRDLVDEADHPVVAIDPAAYYGGIGAPNSKWLPHGDVREVPYAPETERYGGPDALPLAEDLFCRSTEVALAVLRSAGTPSAKLTAGMELAMATTIALDLDRPAAAAWLRLMAASWRYAQEPAAPPTMESHIAAHQILGRNGKELAARWHREPTGAVGYWIDEIRNVRAQVDLAPGVWASQLHMLFNRIGIGPDQERMICWVVAGTALNPGGITSFHDDGPAAVDRRYLEASKFLPGFTDQFPRKEIAEARAMPWHRTVELPEPQPVPATLTMALHARHTSRGDALTGSLTAQELATLLWTAQGGRPYPSAGAQYIARLRVIALNVEGLEPGCYDTEEVGRTLTWTGPAPSTKDLESTSMWLGRDTTALAGTPAVLALYVRVGALRQTYGVRALRFAFAEAGHLAQNLGLVAAAMNLGMGLIGGIYDDLAHDLLALDGVNDTVVYLIPVASPP
ncbi:MAG: thiopeptide-type bacteriocin biosynthesis protein [Kibdelosporangium sp.]